MKQRLFIDFDGTIFQTKKFETAFFDVLIRAGIPETELRSTYQVECLTYKFSLKNLVTKLHQRFNFNFKLTMARLDVLFENIPDKYIYPDVESFFNKINRTNYSIELITLGDPEFQKKKVERSNLLQFFDHAYFVIEQKWLWLVKYVDVRNQFIIIDDRGDTIYEVKKRFKNALALEINRNNFQSDLMEPRKRYDNIVVKNLKQAGMYL